MQPPSLTLGVEEEYQIIDPKTRELTSYITQILEADHRFLEQVKPELHQSIVEVGTKICTTPAEVRTELVNLRGAVIELAARNGLKIVAAGTHPGADPGPHGGGREGGAGKHGRRYALGRVVVAIPPAQPLVPAEFQPGHQPAHRQLA
jgi:hypothetical protein